MANGQAVPPIGQPGVPPAQLNVSAVLLLPGAPAQWGPATTNPNPAPVPQNALSPINQPQAQGQVVPGVVSAQAQPPINQLQPQPQLQPQVNQGALPAQAQPPINQPQGQGQEQAQGQVGPGVVQAQPRVDPGAVLAQPQPGINQPQGQAQGQAQGQVGPGSFRRNLNLPQWLACRKDLSYSILHQAAQAAAQAAAQQTAQQTARQTTHMAAHLTAHTIVHMTAHMTALHRHPSYVIPR